MGDGSGKKTGKALTKGQAQAQEQGQAQAPATAKSAANCNKIKVIAKRYIELDELNEDNGKEVYFDKKYDSTAYDIGEKFKAESNMSLAEQVSHYIGKLTKNKGMNEINARRDAEVVA